MPNLEITFLEQTLANPFLLEIEPLETLLDLNGVEKWGGIIISPFPYEMKDAAIVDSTLGQAYLENIALWRKTVNIPVIASLNGTVGQSMEDYCAKIEEAGAHAISLRLFFCPDDKDFRSADYEKIFLETVARITYSVRIPLVLSLPVCFTNLFSMVEQLFYRGVQGFCPSFEQVVMDIDIEQFEFNSTYDDGTRLDYRFYLKWIAYLSAYFPRANFAVQIHTQLPPEIIIKYLLSGAHAFVIKKGEEQLWDLDYMLDYLSHWMQKCHFQKIEHFQGQLNFQPSLSPSAFERNCFKNLYRTQFLSDVENQESAADSRKTD